MSTIGHESINLILNKDSMDVFEAGLNKREYFAAQAMNGLLTDPQMNEDIRGTVNCAVRAADLLIIELNKEVKSE